MYSYRIAWDSPRFDLDPHPFFLEAFAAGTRALLWIGTLCSHRSASFTMFVESEPGCPDPLQDLTSFLIFDVIEDREERWSGERRVESGERSAELFSQEKNRIETPTNIYATLCNFCNRRAVTIQTSTLPGSLQQ